MNIIRGTNVSVVDYASQGNAILGIRDSGKTYTAMYLAERLLDAGIPIVAFDPIGVWKYLRVPGKGKAYKVVVAGGRDGDLKLTPQSAPEIVRAAMRENIPLVIDLYDIHLSKNDWKSVVEQCIRLLLYENGDHGLRHIFIEEAAEFVPQRLLPDQGRVYAEMEKLARMGGNAKLGYTLINQRGEEVNKAVLELCDCLFLHRQKGRNSLTALSKWLDVASVGESLKITKSLPLLPQGECWLWSAGSDQPIKIKVPEKRTLHPDRRAMLSGSKKVDIQKTDVTAFVEQMAKTLETHLQQVKDNDPALLRKRVRELEKLLAENKPEVQIEQIPVLQNNEIESLRQIVSDLVPAIKSVTEIGSALLGASNAIAAQINMAQSKAVSFHSAVTLKKAVKPDLRIYDKGEPKFGITTNSNGKLPEGEKAILTVCGQYPNGANRKQITVLAGYKRSTRDAYIQRLQGKGFVIVDGDLIRITQDGINALGSDFQELPTGEALREYWFYHLPEGEGRILVELCKVFPNSISRDQLTDITGYQRSTRDAYIQRLSSRMLVDIQGRGSVSASRELFED